MEVKVKRLYESAKLPTYATPGAACFDIYATTDGHLGTDLHMGYGSCATIATGLSFEIPEGHVMLVYSRSGHAFKENVRLANCVGVIDSDYRGELMIKLAHDAVGTCRERFSINPGDRIAQGMIVPVNQVVFVEADELTDSERGNGGFGSTGR